MKKTNIESVIFLYAMQIVICLKQKIKKNMPTMSFLQHNARDGHATKHCSSNAQRQPPFEVTAADWGYPLGHCQSAVETVLHAKVSVTVLKFCDSNMKITLQSCMGDPEDTFVLYNLACCLIVSKVPFPYIFVLRMLFFFFFCSHF